MSILGNVIEAIGGFLGRVRVGGFTIPAILKRNRDNTKKGLYDDFRAAVQSGADPEIYNRELEKKIKARKRAALTTLKNTQSAIRGEARAALSRGKQGIWANITVLDANTTDTCISFIGATWRLPYSQIENKPPRMPPPHPCRSILLFREDAIEYEPEASFITQFNADEELQKELLGPAKYAAMLAGAFVIGSFAEYERVVLTTAEELGLDEQ